MNSRITQINKQNTIYENIKKSKKYFKNNCSHYMLIISVYMILIIN
jgi:hypothetical protein